MPIRTVTTPADLKDVKEEYLIFYSSIVNGKLWCPDCVAVDSIVQKTFASEEGPSAVIVYVGNLPQWKTSSNVFRGAPWKVQSVPTIIKLQEGIEVARLVDSEIKSGLSSFIKA